MNSKFLKILAFSFYLLSFPSFSFPSQWINPKDAIGDAMIARLQQGREELTPSEKEEIERYGYTGLELMTYLYDNKHPGYQDNDELHRCLYYIGGTIESGLFLARRKYHYKSLKDKLTYNGLKPGESIEWMMIGIALEPPNQRGFGLLNIYYTESEKKFRDNEQFTWQPALRRIRRNVAPNKQDEFGKMVITHDDDEVREPWEEDHRILGEDELNGKKCFVIESKHRLIPEYYLSKRVTWVEKDNFLDLHEEQFDRQGKLYKIFDTEWYQAKPGKYWVPRETNIIKFPTKDRTVHQTPHWIVDQGLKDEDFSFRVLEKERPWRKVEFPFRPIKTLSDFPPEPKIRWEFWNKIGVNVK